MIVSLEDMKQYLRVDYDDDDAIIKQLIAGSVQLCLDILRIDSETELEACDNARIAVMYTVAYLYEHREEADHHGLTITLRSLLFGSRKEAF